MTTQSRSDPNALLTVQARLRRSRGVLVFFGLLLLAPVLVWQTSRNILRELAAPSIGLHVTSLATVENVEDRWSDEVALGDRVVAINGQPIRHSGEFAQARLALAPGPVSLTFERDGRRWTEQAATTSWSGPYQFSAWLRVVTGTILLLFGLGVFMIRPVGVVSWLFLLACYDIALLVLLRWLSLDPRLVAYLYYPLMVLAPCLCLHLFTVFPDPLELIAERPRRALLIYLPAIVIPPAAYTWFLDSGPWKQVWQVADHATWGWLVGATLTAFGSMGVRYRKAAIRQDDRLLAQYRTLMGCVILGMLLPIGLLVLIVVFGVWSDTRWAYDASVGTIIAFPALLAYTVVRYNALSVDRFTASAVGYGATLSIVGAGYAALLFVLSWLATELGLASSPTLLVVTTAATVITAGPIFRRVKARIDRWFSREQTSALRTLEIIHELRAHIQDAPGSKQAIDLAMNALDILKPERAELWRLSEEGDLLKVARTMGELTEPRPESVELTRALCGVLRKGHAGGVKPLCQMGLGEAAEADLWELRLAAAAPLRSQGRLLGFLGVGRRVSGTAYPVEEVIFLSNVATELGNVIARDGDEGARVGRYRIEKRLGVGGMAEVFLAWQLGPGGFERRVALKKPLPDVAEDPRFVGMFLDEARIAAGLRHDNVAQIYEVDKDANTYFLAMEYVDGPSLRMVLRRAAEHGYSVPAPIAIAMLTGILNALEHVHGQEDERGKPLGLVHRDVTSNNILMTRAGKPKLVDFGIARAGAALQRTQTGVIRGTIPYMSPEQAAGKRVDKRTDLYSAGVLAYEVLTLARPYPMGPLPKPPSAPSRVRPDLPAAVDGVLFKAMAYEADDRYSSATELRRELVQALGGLGASDEMVAAWMASLPESKPPVANPLTSETSAAEPGGATAVTRDVV